MQGLPSAEPDHRRHDRRRRDEKHSGKRAVHHWADDTYSANVSGSDGYWISQQEKLQSAVEQLPSPTVFTYSAVDHHWLDLHRLMPSFLEDSPADIRERNKAQIETPRLADWWFWERLRLWKKVFLGPKMADQL